MDSSISYVYILTKSRQEKSYALGCDIMNWLKARGVKAQVQDHELFQNGIGQGTGRPDLILILGGDGTMLSVARKIGLQEIPMLGLNMGQVGFLTELCTEKWSYILQDVLNGCFSISPRIVLDYQVLRDCAVLHQGRVVNDLVISRGGMARLARLKISYGPSEMSELRADGLLISTPTGSTAYAVAAGGALISPELEVVEVCPICPFLSGFKPVVLPSHESLQVDVLSPSPDMFLTQDGQAGLPLLAGDKILINQSPGRLFFVQPHGSNYVKKLRLKGYL